MCLLSNPRYMYTMWIKKNTVQIKIMTNRIIDFLFHAAYSFFRRRAQFCHFLLNSAWLFGNRNITVNDICCYFSSFDKSFLFRYVLLTLQWPGNSKLSISLCTVVFLGLISKRGRPSPSDDEGSEGVPARQHSVFYWSSMCCNMQFVQSKL